MVLYLQCVFGQWYCICVVYLDAAGTLELTWYQPCAGLETAFGQIFIQLYFQEEILAKYLLQISLQR